MGKKQKTDLAPQVFVDANIYISLFKAKPSLEYFEKLVELVEAKKFNLIFPGITRSEVYREVSETLANEKSKNNSFVFPKTPKEFNDDTKKKLGKLEDDWCQLWESESEKHLEILEQKKEMAKVLFGGFMKLTRNYKLTDEILKKANDRQKLRMPPGKTKDPIGDQIAWELILENCTSHDLIIVSIDSDFVDVTNPNKINPLLIGEWSTRSKCKISIETDLGKLIKKFDKGFKLSKEESKKDKQISHDSALESSMAINTSSTPSVSESLRTVNWSVLPSASSASVPSSGWVTTTSYPISSASTSTSTSSGSSNYSSQYNLRCLSCNSLVSFNYVFCPYCGNRL